MRVKKRTISGTFFGNTVKAIEFSLSVFNQVYVNVQIKIFVHNSDKKWPLPDQVSAVSFSGGPKRANWLYLKI